MAKSEEDKKRELSEAYSRMSEDELAKLAGEAVSLTDAATVRMDWFLSNALGGIKLCVRRDDAEAALNFLEEIRTQESYEEEDRAFEEPQCPRCQSKEVSLGETERNLSYGSAILEMPMPAEHPGWKCHASGHPWGENAEPEK